MEHAYWSLTWLASGQIIATSALHYLFSVYYLSPMIYDDYYIYKNYNFLKYFYFNIFLIFRLGYHGFALIPMNYERDSQPQNLCSIL